MSDGFYAPAVQVFSISGCDASAPTPLLAPFPTAVQYVFLNDLPISVSVQLFLRLIHLIKHMLKLVSRLQIGFQVQYVGAMRRHNGFLSQLYFLNAAYSCALNHFLVISIHFLI